MNPFRTALAALAAVTTISVATPAKAASVLHEFDDRAILEFMCRAVPGETLAIATITQQFGGSVNYVSAVIVPAGGRRSPLVERDIPAGEATRVGHIFNARYKSATINGYFLGISGDGNPIRYSIPENLTVDCN